MVATIQPSAHWTTSRWLSGGNISPGASSAAQFTTAFDVLDKLVGRLMNRELFAGVQIVTLVGFSAGAQLSSRYAFATPLGAPRDVDGAPRLRFVVSDPGTYLYLDDTRPAASCRAPRDTGPDATCGAFEVPPEAETCPSYDDYKYGLSALGNLNLYLAPMEANATLRNAAVMRFAEKDVIYILGSEDACNCGLAGFENDADVCFPKGGSKCSPTLFAGCCDTWPSTSNALADTCAADLQGTNRLQRGLLFVAYLQSRGSESAVFVANFGHNDADMYNTAAFRDSAFAV